jgi:hypothetical protein
VQQVGEVLRGVPGRGDDLERQPTQLEFVTVTQRPVGVGELAAGRGQKLRAGTNEFATTGDEVGMQVGLHHEPWDESTPGELAQIGPRITLRVDDQRATITQIHHVGAVAQPLVHQRDYIHDYLHLFKHRLEQKRDGRAAQSQADV